MDAGSYVGSSQEAQLAERLCLYRKHRLSRGAPISGKNKRTEHPSLPGRCSPSEHPNREGPKFALF